MVVVSKDNTDEFVTHSLSRRPTLGRSVSMQKDTMGKA